MDANQLINDFLDTHPEVCRQWPLKARESFRHMCDHDQVKVFFNSFLDYVVARAQGGDIPQEKISMVEITCLGCSVSLQVPDHVPLLITCPICGTIAERTETGISLIRGPTRTVPGEVLDAIKKKELEIKEQVIKESEDGSPVSPEEKNP